MIYLDNAASAPVHPKALSAAMPFITENFANPSSAHTLGREARLAVIAAREQCAAAIGAQPEEIYFTIIWLFFPRSASMISTKL